MRKLILLMAMVALVLATAVSPALANTRECKERPGPELKCGHGTFVNENSVDNDNDFDGFDLDFNDDFDDLDFGFNPFFVPVFVDDNFDSDCPFWGDDEGSVNQWDCLD